MKDFAMHNLFLYVVCTTTCLFTVIAQDPCSGPSNINVEFPELDPPSPVPLGDSRFAQVILPGQEPFSVTIQADTSASNQFPFDEYFSHSYNTFGANPGYTVYMIKGIDRDGPTSAQDDDTNILQYTVICQSNPTSDPLYKILKIQILDQNDSPPTFVDPPQLISISELTPVGTTICNSSFPATDLDEGHNKQVTFELGDSCTSHFDLNSPEYGLLVVSNLLDYESSSTFVCVITATDLGTPPQSSSTTFTIMILDGDDQGPEFVYPSCIASTEPLGKTCITPRYKTSIASNSAEQSTLVFKPDPAVANNPDGTVEIVMQDRDDIGSPVACRIASTIPAGYDSYFTATASFISGKQYKCTVVHQANKPIDYASVPELDIIIEAVEDSDNHRTEAATINVEITTEDSGNCGSLPCSLCSGPSNIAIEFPELDPPSSVPSGDARFAQVILSGEPFSVTIQNDQTAPNQFPFDEYFTHSYNPFGANQGYTVYMIKGIDRDGPTCSMDDDVNILQYTLICQETSNSDPLYKILKINIKDQNDNTPALINPPQLISINELTPVSTTICSFNFFTCDLDEGVNKQVTFELEDSCTSHFDLTHPDKGVLVVTNHLDYESTNEYNCVITATDKGSPSQSSSASFTISILDGDDQGPEFVYSSCIASTEPLGKTCISPRYKTSIASNSAEQSTLVFKPYPADVSNPDGTVDIVMQDRDTIGSPVACLIASTRPAGYDSYFTATASLISGKQYKCTVVHQANKPINQASIPKLDIIIEAVEDSDYHRTEAATINVEITTEQSG